jgi:hypothetical protein
VRARKEQGCKGKEGLAAELGISASFGSTASARGGAMDGFGFHTMDVSLFCFFFFFSFIHSDIT